jgi:D-alanine-D-alanine ligase
MVKDADLKERLKKAASDIFTGFGGVGYARLDFRSDAEGQLYFLEINFTCSVFYCDGYEGSADYILKLNGVSQSEFFQKIVAEGMERHRQKQKKYRMKGDSIAGYGIYASCDLEAGEIIFTGEERSQRIATQGHIHRNWTQLELENFKKYAYPLSNEVFLLWDEDPTGWAPQNHSCDANTVYRGLDVITTRPVKKDEELTLDYAGFLDDKMEPFHCSCGSAHCRGYITGITGNSVTSREANITDRTTPH